MLNRKRDKGSPYRRPLLGLNSSVGDPLTMTEHLEDWRHSRIQPLHLTPKPNSFIIDKRQPQLTESYAFWKSSLRTTPFFLLTFHQSTISLAIKTPSSMFLPPKNANCASPITLGTTFFNLLANTLARILYIDPIRLIGLKSEILLGQSTLGIRVIKELCNPEANFPLS